MSRLGYPERPTRPLTTGSDPDWYRDHENLAGLYRHLRESGREPDDPQEFLDEPWHWDDSWVAMWAERGDKGALALLEERAV